MHKTITESLRIKITSITGQDRESQRWCICRERRAVGELEQQTESRRKRGVAGDEGIRPFAGSGEMRDERVTSHEREQRDHGSDE